MPRASACGTNILKRTVVDENFFSSGTLSADSDIASKLTFFLDLTRKRSFVKISDLVNELSNHSQTGYHFFILVE